MLISLLLFVLVAGRRTGRWIRVILRFVFAISTAIWAMGIGLIPKENTDQNDVSVMLIAISIFILFVYWLEGWSTKLGKSDEGDRTDFQLVYFGVGFFTLITLTVPASIAIHRDSFSAQAEKLTKYRQLEIARAVERRQLVYRDELRRLRPDEFKRDANVLPPIPHGNAPLAGVYARPLPAEWPNSICSGCVARIFDHEESFPIPQWMSLCDLIPTALNIDLCDPTL